VAKDVIAPDHLGVHQFQAMGSPCRVVVAVPQGNDQAAAIVARQAGDLVRKLEQTWSRFSPASEISFLNSRCGAVTGVSDETYRLLESADTAWRATAGRYHPLMLDQIEAIGYWRSWDEGTPSEGDFKLAHPATQQPIEFYPEIKAVKLPSHARFDPGGIGKGLAVDMAVEICLAAGATTVGVELGGDLRVEGTPWYGAEWKIGVADPFDPSVDVGAFTPTAGAVTTSTTMKRRWKVNGRSCHHLIDPDTGLPTESNLVSVTTCSSLAWWAEVAAKSALLAGSTVAPDLLHELNTHGLAVTNEGAVLKVELPHKAREVQ